MAEERKSEWKTLSGLKIPEAFDTPNAAGQPPYTSGIHESMYRSRLWTMRQYAGFSSAKETNERFSDGHYCETALIELGKMMINWFKEPKRLYPNLYNKPI